MRCPNCQKITRVQAKFCPACGYRLSTLRASTGKADVEGLKDTFKGKLIDWKNMSPFLRVLLFMVFVQIGVVVLLFLTKNIAQPQVNSTVMDANGNPYQVSLTVFIIMAISIAVGYWFALAGAFYVHWSVRLPVVLLATGLLAITPITALVVMFATNVKVGFGPVTMQGWLRGMQLGVLAIFWLWVIRTLVRARHEQHDIPKNGSGPQWYTHPFVVVLALLLVYYGLELGVWLIYKRVGVTTSAAAFFLQPFGVQALLLTTLLSLILIMGSTDLLEWGEVIASSIVTFINWKRVPWLILILTPLTAISLIVYVLWLDGRQVLLELVIALGLVGIVTLLARFAWIGPNWPTEIPAPTILILAVFLYIYGTVLSSIASTVSDARGLSLTLFYAIVSMPIAVVGLTIGLFLIARGRAGNTTWGAIGLSLSMMVLLLITSEIPAFLRAFGFLVAYPAYHFSLLNGIKMLVALVTLIWIVGLILRRRVLVDSTEQFATTFLLLIGLQTVSWVDALLKLIANLQGLSTVLLAGLFLLTVLWSLITSGKSVTNIDSPGFPRTGSTLLYLGYTLIATAMLLYFGTLTVQGAPDASVPDYLTNDYVSLGSLVILGPSLVALGFFLRTRHRASSLLLISSSQPSKRVSPRSMQFGIIGGGIVGTLLLVVFVPVYLLAHPLQAKLNQPYSTIHPGPGCDTGGAVWSIAPGQPISTNCQLNGLQITVPAHRLGAVMFEPPNRTFPQNYRVSIRFIDSTISNGCVYIEMRASGTDYYANILCSAPSGSIDLMHDGHLRQLATRTVTPAKTYTIEATADGTIQRLAINGVVVASISDTTLSHTDFIALGVSNFGNKDATAVFSNFIFTPLA